MVVWIKRLIICRDCQQEREELGRGLCGACYQHRRRHGVPRPSWDHPLFARIAAAKRGEAIHV